MPAFALRTASASRELSKANRWLPPLPWRQKAMPAIGTDGVEIVQPTASSMCALFNVPDRSSDDPPVVGCDFERPHAAMNANPAVPATNARRVIIAGQGRGVDR